LIFAANIAVEQEAIVAAIVIALLYSHVQSKPSIATLP